MLKISVNKGKNETKKYNMKILYKSWCFFQFCLKITILTCFLTPGNIITNAKNNVANKMHTATIDTSYVTDVRLDIV